MRKRLVGLLAGAVDRVRGMRDGGQSVAVGVGAGIAAGYFRRASGFGERGRQRSTSPSTDYAPEEGTDGGSIIIGDWQEANQFNPVLPQPGHRGQRRLGDLATLFVFTHDYKYGPDLATEIPTLDNGGVKLPATTATR